MIIPAEVLLLCPRLVRLPDQTNRISYDVVFHTHPLLDAEIFFIMFMLSIPQVITGDHMKFLGCSTTFDKLVIRFDKMMTSQLIFESRTFERCRTFCTFRAPSS